MGGGPITPLHKNYKVCTKTTSGCTRSEAKEEGASCDPLRGSAFTVVVYYDLKFGVGHYPWSRWRVDTKGVPVTYLQGIRRTWGLTRPPPLRGYPFTR